MPVRDFSLYSTMVRYRRAFSDNPDDVFFLTLVTASREPRFKSKSDFETIWSAIQLPLELADAELIAWVFLPDHLHLLLKQGSVTFSRTVQRFKSNANRLFLPQGGSLWQSRFWEHRIRDENDMRKHIEYIHYNPVRHRHCNSPIDWRYSSFREYVEKGLYEKDWSEGDVKLDYLKQLGEPEE